jgi:hypothetical protein
MQVTVVALSQPVIQQMLIMGETMEAEVQGVVQEIVIVETIMQIQAIMGKTEE